MAATINVASRNLTDVFVLMRNNSLQNRHIFSDQGLDDKVALVSAGEAGSINGFPETSVDLPPAWIEGIDDIHYEMSRIRQKMQELTLLHDKHLTRPSLDDAVQEEKEIETVTQDITRMFQHCKKIINQIRERNVGNTQQEVQIKKNILSSLVSSLQDLSSMFHMAQSTHLRKLRSREEKSQQFFNTSYFNASSETGGFDAFQDDSFNQSFLKTSTEQQQAFVETNTFMVEQREREIKKIVRSLVELNDIFRDLATMVADQGTVLDRIDYNLEQVQTQVHSGLQQLQKAEKYHRKNRKMLCILGLASAIVVMVIILIVLKT